MRKICFWIVLIFSLKTFAQNHKINVAYNFGSTSERIKTSIPGIDKRRLDWVDGLELGLNRNINKRIEAGINAGFYVGLLSLLSAPGFSAINKIRYYSFGLNVKFSLADLRNKTNHPFVQFEGRKIFHFPELLHIENADYGNRTLLIPGIGYRIVLFKVSALDLILKRGITPFLVRFNIDL